MRKKKILIEEGKILFVGQGCIFEGKSNPWVEKRKCSVTSYARCPDRPYIADHGKYEFSGGTVGQKGNTFPEMCAIPFHSLDDDGRLHFSTSMLRTLSTIAFITEDKISHTVRSTLFDTVISYPRCVYHVQRYPAGHEFRDEVVHTSVDQVGYPRAEAHRRRATRVLGQV